MPRRTTDITAVLPGDTFKLLEASILEVDDREPFVRYQVFVNDHDADVAIRGRTKVVSTTDPSGYEWSQWFNVPNLLQRVARAGADPLTFVFAAYGFDEVAVGARNTVEGDDAGVIVIGRTIAYTAPPAFVLAGGESVYELEVTVGEEDSDSAPLEIRVGTSNGTSVVGTGPFQIRMHLLDAGAKSLAAGVLAPTPTGDSSADEVVSSSVYILTTDADGLWEGSLDDVAGGSDFTASVYLSLVGLPWDPSVNGIDTPFEVVFDAV